MGVTLSEKSITNLEECDLALQALFKALCRELPLKTVQDEIIAIHVVEGHRTLEEQRKYYHDGKSKTMKSKHLHTPSLATDVALETARSTPDIDWDNGNKRNLYPEWSKVVKRIASVMDIPVEWGGDWKTLRDYVHWQLPTKSDPGRVFPPPEVLNNVEDIIGSLMADAENMQTKLVKLRRYIGSK